MKKHQYSHRWLVFLLCVKLFHLTIKEMNRFVHSNVIHATFDYLVMLLLTKGHKFTFFTHLLIFFIGIFLEKYTSLFIQGYCKSSFNPHIILVTTKMLRNFKNEWCFLLRIYNLFFSSYNIKKKSTFLLFAKTTSTFLRGKIV